MRAGPLPAVQPLHVEVCTTGLGGQVTVPENRRGPPFNGDCNKDFASTPVVMKTLGECTALHTTVLGEG